MQKFEHEKTAAIEGVRLIKLDLMCFRSELEFGPDDLAFSIRAKIATDFIRVLQGEKLEQDELMHLMLLLKGREYKNDDIRKMMKALIFIARKKRMRKKRARKKKKVNLRNF